MPDAASLARLIGPNGVRVKRMQEQSNTRIVINSRFKKSSYKNFVQAPVPAHDSNAAAAAGAGAGAADVAATEGGDVSVGGTTVAMETGEGTSIWHDVRVEVFGDNIEDVEKAEYHTRKEVEIEILRAHMYSLMGATDLAWRKRQQQSHLPERVRKRPIYRDNAALATASTSETDPAVEKRLQGGGEQVKGALGAQVHRILAEMYKKCEAVGSPILYKDYDAVLVIANMEVDVPLATLVVDRMIADPLIRLEMRHWTFFMNVCMKKSDLNPLMERLSVIGENLSRTEDELCLDLETYLVSATEPVPRTVVHFLNILEGYGKPISPRLRRSFLHYHFWTGLVEEAMEVIHGKGISMGIETQLLILEGALLRKARKLPYVVCSRLLQMLERSSDTSKTDIILKIDTAIADTLAHAIELEEKGGGAPPRRRGHASLLRR